MKGKKLLAGILSAVMVLGTMVMPAFAEGTLSVSGKEVYEHDGATTIGVSVAFGKDISWEAGKLKFELCNNDVVMAETTRMKQGTASGITACFYYDNAGEPSSWTTVIYENTNWSVNYQPNILKVYNGDTLIGTGSLPENWIDGFDLLKLPDYVVTTTNELDNAARNAKDSDVIAVKSGTYKSVDFVGKNNITIQGADENTTVTISELDNFAMIGLRDSNNVTIKNINFVIPENFPALTTEANWQWMTGVIGFGATYMLEGNKGTGLTVENCTFTNNSGVVDNAIIYDSAVTVKNSKFTNFEMAIRVLADGNPLTSSEISGNTFTRVNEPVNAYWGKTDENAAGEISFKNNTVASAKDSDKKPVISIWDYANSSGDNSTIKNIDLSGNTYNTETITLVIDTTESATANTSETPVNTYSSAENAMRIVSNNKTFYIGTDANAAAEQYTKTAAQEYVNSKNERFSTKAAKIGDVYYDTLEAAFEAAQEEDTIILLEDATGDKAPTLKWNTNHYYLTNAHTIDLNGHTLSLKASDIWVTPDTNDAMPLTIKSSATEKGILDVSGCTVNGTAVFYLHAAQSLVLDNVTVNANGVTGYALFAANSYDAHNKVTLKNSEIISNSTTKGVSQLFDQCDMDIVDTKITASNVGKIGQYGKITISGKSEITASNVKVGFYMPIEASSLEVKDNAKIHLTNVTGDSAWNPTAAGICLGENTPYTEANSATVNATVYRKPGANNIADAMKVSFTDATAENAEGEKVYNIFVETDSDKTINRLTAVQLGLKLDDSTTGDFAMTVSNADGATAPSANGVYLFNFDGETRPSVTGTKIKIGQVKLVGYGTFTLSIDAAKDNKAHTLTNEGENLVTDFVPSPANGEGSLDISAKLDDISVAIATRKLTVNIDFNHTVQNQAAEYQAMTVTVTGPKGFTKTVKLGNGTDATPIVNNKATVVFDNVLTLHTGYTVEVAGDGYRTAPYYVSMDSDKTLTFWNNYKDQAVKVEGRADEVAKNATFLAGEIVKDGKINIYDLSAVVSYFGMNTDTTAVSDYARYDLDRNGKIDSKDVAYVLASWER